MYDVFVEFQGGAKVLSGYSDVSSAEEAVEEFIEHLGSEVWFVLIKKNRHLVKAIIVDGERI